VGEGEVKLVLRGSRSLPVRSSLGNERWFSSTVEVGEGERGVSSMDMDNARWFNVRIVEEVSRGGVEGWLPIIWEDTQMPVTNMNLRRASSVSIGICSCRKKGSASMSVGVRAGVCVCRGVGGDVADGIAYESMTSMRLRVIVAMMGCRLELALMVLKVYFLSSCAGGATGGACEVADMLENLRERAGFSTQRALSARPWSVVVLNSKPPFGISVTSHRLAPSSMHISVTPLSLLAGEITPTTSLSPQCSSSDVGSSSTPPYASALTTSRSLNPSLSRVLKVRASRRVDRWGSSEKGMTS
jgi:hypothetical protein